jgi:hypothetical protein
MTAALSDGGKTGGGKGNDTGLLEIVKVMQATQADSAEAAQRQITALTRAARHRVEHARREAVAGRSAPSQRDGTGAT